VRNVGDIGGAEPVEANYTDGSVRHADIVLG
jgi:hypothetical protein